MASIRPGPNGHQLPPQYGPPPPRPNGYPMGSMAQSLPPPASPNQPSPATMKQLADMNTATWVDVGRLAENMNDIERAKLAYEMAIKNNHDSIPAKKALALLYKDKLKNLEKVRLAFHDGADCRRSSFFRAASNRIPNKGIFMPF